MGISVALTPSTSTVTVSKSMITNASFRTKKLPGKLLDVIIVLGIHTLTNFKRQLCAFRVGNFNANNFRFIDSTVLRPTLILK